MKYIEEIAFYKNRRDEVPNQELAALLAEKEEHEGIREIADSLTDKNKSIQSDCMKVLYEIGYIKPQLITPYADRFLYHLNSRNNRMVWGAMIALSSVAPHMPEMIMESFDLIKKKTDEGTLITHVWGIYVMINTCKGGEQYKKKLFPLLLDYCRDCRPIDFAKRIESVLEITELKELPLISAIVDQKRENLSETQFKRAERALKRFKKNQ